MLLDAIAAKALFAIVLGSAQGADEVRRQQPLQVEDRDGAWLVKGTPYSSNQGNFHMCHAFFRKSDAAVTGINCEARVAPTAEEDRHWRATFSQAEYDRIFGPPTWFEPVGIHPVWAALYHGIVTKPADAVDYATALLQRTPALAGTPKGDLGATEHDGIWHVTARGRTVLRIARDDGRVLDAP